MATKKTACGNPMSNWCWTLNNYTLEEIVLLRTLVLTGKCKYIMWGKEVGESGTPHLQGYLELVKKERITGIRKWMPPRVANLDPRRGTQDQAINYCKKDGLFEEHGEKTVQPGCSLSEKENLIQNQLIDLRSQILAGASEPQIYEANPYLAARFPKFISKLTEWRVPEIRDNLVIELHVGPTGSGKTSQAFQRFPTIYNMPVKSGTTLWFNGYYGQKVVLLDDFKGGFGLDNLLRLLDKFPIQVENKGGFHWFVPERIIMTSNFEEKEWYDYSKREEHFLALQRRIHDRYRWRKGYHSIKCDKEWNQVPEPTLLEDSSEDLEDPLRELSPISQWRALYEEEFHDNETRVAMETASEKEQNGPELYRSTEKK